MANPTEATIQIASAASDPVATDQTLRGLAFGAEQDAEHRDDHQDQHRPLRDVPQRHSGVADALLGIIGALVAIPVAAAIKLLFDELLTPRLDER